MTERDLDTSSTALRAVLKSQYRAALAMLRESIELCPEELWNNEDDTNAFWQIAYHTLFFAHLYLQPDEAAFRPWAQHQDAVQHPDGIAGPRDPDSDLPLIPNPYSRTQVLEYLSLCDEMVDSAVDALDLSSEESGFSWYRVPKLEHQIVNIRHIQHHTGQLTDRIRKALGAGVRWAGARRAE